MNHNFNLDLAKAYRANDLQAASKWRRRQPIGLDPTVPVAERAQRLGLAALRRLVPRQA